MTFLFTSESVGIGHPDKLCDQISDAILDACLAQDPHSRVACEALVTSGLLLLAGEISTNAYIEYSDIARETIKYIGYTSGNLGFDHRSCGIAVSIHRQSPDIARGIEPHRNEYHQYGAGDQGIMFGYACDDTPELMPLPIMMAHRLVQKLRYSRENNILPYLRPDCKSQVTVEYREDFTPLRINAIVLSAQHDDTVHIDTLRNDMSELIKASMPSGLIDHKTRLYINPTGRFVIGGPQGDTGLTGRKTIVDTYGGMGHHGGGCFSGKDPTKVDRSAAYGARYVAKNIVAAQLARRCEVQLSYAIGVPSPISIKVDTFGTGNVPEARLAEIIPQVFDLSPFGLINSLNLQRPIYLQTAFGGHFGREGDAFTWESTDKVDELLDFL
ncbi:MAG: methionine adenosyltransferase [Chlamydiales bacterium]